MDLSKPLNTKISSKMEALLKGSFGRTTVNQPGRGGVIDPQSGFVQCLTRLITHVLEACVFVRINYKSSCFESTCVRFHVHVRSSDNSSLGSDVAALDLDFCALRACGGCRSWSGCSGGGFGGSGFSGRCLFARGSAQFAFSTLLTFNLEVLKAPNRPTETHTTPVNGNYLQVSTPSATRMPFLTHAFKPRKLLSSQNLCNFNQCDCMCIEHKWKTTKT